MPEKNIKRCVICGAPFPSPPSDKTTTCSPACRSENARRRAIITKSSDRFQTPESRKKRSQTSKRSPAVREASEIGRAAALENPVAQRGEQNQEAKVWFLVTPDEMHLKVTNLTAWARENYDFFFPDAEPEELDRVAKMIQKGFSNIDKSMRGKTKRPVYHYKGWGLYDLPREKTDEEQQTAMDDYWQQKAKED